MTPVVEVAAAVMLRDGGRRFLLAQRPPGKVYAGYWEFPGGKLEAGESVRDALVRELYEELGITVTACSPWLTRQFTYPHATVRLNFWRVTAWTGEIGITAPLEHSAVNWQACTEAAQVSPILPANFPILKALSLPESMAITNAEAQGIDRELERVETALNKGLRLLQLRDKGLPGAARKTFGMALRQQCSDHGALLMVNGDAQLAHELSADGLHLTATQLAELAQRPDFAWVGASCHTAEEIARAGELALDYALLGPVLPTPTHPEQRGLGWPGFAQACAGNTLPVFALGGQTPAMLHTAQGHGAHGIALMRGW